jgi:hypothetical protein
VYERTILPFEHNSDGFYICKMRKIWWIQFIIIQEKN